MVRIKQRYLLVHILYPYPTDPAAKNSSKSQENALPQLVQFHRPSPDDLTPQLLVRTIRDQVLLLYGDYGLGLVSSSLISRFHASQIHGLLVKSWHSQISLHRNLHSHNSLFTRTLPPRMGCVVIHDATTKNV